MINSPEFSLEKIASEEMISKIIKDNEFNRLQLNNFKGSEKYFDEDIDNDEIIVESLKEKFSNDTLKVSSEVSEIIKRSDKRAEALEIIINEQSEMAEWLGPDVFTIRTTEYDDFVNGVDMVLEFITDEKDVERIALAIDASCADFGIIGKKIDRNINKIIGKDRKKPKVKYFQSEADPSVKETIEGVIPVVIGIEGRNVDSLVEDFSSNEKTKKMGRHPAQKVFLEEIRMQLEAYLNILDRNDNKYKPNIEGDKIKTILEIIEGIIDQKKDIDMGYLKNDRVLSSIKMKSDISNLEIK